MKKQEARKYTSKILQNVLARITPLEQERCNCRMKVAVKIDELMKSDRLTKEEFSQRINKSVDEVSFMLSGCKNFTLDELSEIAFSLNRDTEFFLNTNY